MTATQKRKKLFSLLAIGLAFIGLVYIAYDYFIGSRHVETENAYVAADISQVTPFTGGTVQEIKVIDTAVVKKGDVLVVLDDIDAKLALATAQANLARAQVEYDRAEHEYKRRKSLSQTGSVSDEEISNTQNATLAAKAARDAMQVAVDRAELDLERTIIRAPIDGVVAKRQVQLGQRVAVGSPLMSIVPVDALYVNANFKESQLASVRVGQKAEIVSDLYGSSIVFNGVVEGISGGTGSAFAVIPAQNATGNWIKVVQRLPIRIKLDPEELKEHPLQVGLSMHVDVELTEDKE